MSLETITRTPLPQSIVKRVQEFIASQHLQQGDKLPPERVLMEQLGVGRSSVREAMKILATLGLVEIRRGDGAYVTKPGRVWNLGASAFLVATEKNFLRDMVEVRRSIEPMAAMLAATRATDEDIADLETMLLGHQEQLAHQEAWHWEPLEFELAIAESTDNRLLREMQDSLHNLWVGLSSESRQSVDRTVEWLHEHWVIFDAIKARNPRRASEAVLLHLDLERFEEDLRR